MLMSAGPAVFASPGTKRRPLISTKVRLAPMPRKSTVAVPSEQTSAALDGVDFGQGQRYLLTATGGVVNGCGFSGPATPELERAFDEAFPG